MVVIFPGSVGFGINCGVNLIRNVMSKQEIKRKKRELIEELYKEEASGLGFMG